MSEPRSTAWMACLVAACLVVSGCEEELVDDDDDGDGGSSSTSTSTGQGGAGGGTSSGGGTGPVCGGWHDTLHGLCWQEPPTPTPVRGHDIDDHCEAGDWGGHQDWRAPTIDEMRALIRGCPGTELGGACEVTDGSSSAVQEGPCWGCDCAQGPSGGCYWDAALGTECGTMSSNWDSFYISDSPLANDFGRAWGIHYRCGVINPDLSRNSEYYVRCVRDAP